MWEVIEKNKTKSVIAFSIMAIWYSLVYGLICALVVYMIILHCTDQPVDNYCIPYIYAYGIVISLSIFIIRFFLLKDKPYNFGSYSIHLMSKSKNRQLYNVVEEVAVASGISKVPKIYILNSDILNAYACGLNPKNSSIVISKALLEALSRDELQGVIAHEMSHIVNRDTTYLLCSGALYTVSAVFTLFLRECLRGRSSKGKEVILILFLLSLLGQAICFLLFMFISRKREYLADACACQYTRYPKGLADALLKIETSYKTNSSIKAPDNLVKASCIVPLTEKPKSDILSTHPSTQNRIKILLNMTTADYKAYEEEFKKLNKTNLIPKSAINNSETISIKTVLENKADPFVLSACAPHTAISSYKQVQTIKENKEILNENIKKHREVNDFVRDLAEYTIINCECSTKLKIPPVYKNTIVICPHCKKKHAIN